MANTLASIISANFQPKLMGNLGEVSPAIKLSLTLAQGVALNQADMSHVAERSVATGTPDDIDLNAGGLLDAMGSPFSAAKIVAMCFKNNSTTVAETLTLGGTGSTFTSWLVGTNPGVLLGPGGFFFLYNPSLAAYLVTPSTGDKQRVTSASGTVSYQAGFLGRSA